MEPPRAAGRPARSLARAAALATALAATAAPSARAEAVRLAIDAGRSEIGFQMHTTWHDVEGKTRGIVGAITSEGGDIFKDGRVSISVEAASLETGNGRRDKTMREAHLETARFPAIAFVSTGPPEIVSSVADALGAYTEVTARLVGDLTVHGVTRPIVLSVTIRRDGKVWCVTGEAPVRLSDHGIPDPSLVFNRVQDLVTVRFSVWTAPSAS